VNQNQLYIIFLLLFIQVLSQTNGELEKDATLCSSHADKDTCSEVQLISDIYQCCLLKITTSAISNFKICGIQVKPISTFKKQMELPSTKALNKEIFGYIIYNYDFGTSPNYYKMNLDYECADGSFTFLYGYDTFTSEEIDILKSDNHCLRYIYNQDIFSSKEDCYDSVLLQSSKDQGLSCGYFEYNFKYSDGSTDTIKSCGIFNQDLVNYNQLDQKTKETIKTFVQDNTEEGKTITSYKVNLSDNKGNSLVYDSLSEEVSNENSEEPIQAPVPKWIIYPNIYWF